MLHGAGNMLWHLIETVVMVTSKLADSLPLGKPFRFWWQIWNYRTGKLQIEKQFVNRHTACFHRYTGIGGGKKKGGKVVIECVGNFAALRGTTMTGSFLVFQPSLRGGSWEPAIN